MYVCDAAYLATDYLYYVFNGSIWVFFFFLVLRLLRSSAFDGSTNSINYSLILSLIKKFVAWAK